MQKMAPDEAKAAVQNLIQDEPKKSRPVNNNITDYVSFGGIYLRSKYNHII
jgi:hypothetical protein